LAVRREPLAHGVEIDGAMMLVDLHGVPDAQGEWASSPDKCVNIRSPQTGQPMRGWLETWALADHRSKRSVRRMSWDDREQFEGFGYLDGRGQIDGGRMPAYAGFNRA
jgi:hypothetical protein